jgi:hypothetical protein
VAGGDAAGGSYQLVELIDEHGKALFFDLLELGMDLRDLWRPHDRRVSRFPVTPRAVLWLAEQMPATAAFTASRQGGLEHRFWPMDTLLLASTVNHLAAANHQRAGKKRAFHQPIEPPTAGKAKPAKRVVRISDVLARRQAALEQAQQN